jgi:hypothetical protein
MRCAVCGKDTRVTCLCGYCRDCLIYKTHKGCEEEVRNRRIEEENAKKKK